MIDLTVFEKWCKKHITELLQPYLSNANIEDLTQESWCIAYKSLNECQKKELPVNYALITKRIKYGLQNTNRKERQCGITYSSNNDTQIDNDIEHYATTAPVYQSLQIYMITKQYEKWLKAQI